jgi:branched-chain amino acid transport system substrate-binding protein
MRRVLGVAAVAIAVSVIAGCGGATVSSSNPGGSSGAAAAPGVTADTITMGMVTPMTGSFAALGTDGKAGAEALISTVNDAGGINGRKLALAVQDDQYDPKQAVAGARYFATQQPVLGIWGNNGTATTLAGMPTLQTAGVPLLFPMALSTQLASYDRSFASMLPLSSQFELLSNYAATQPDLATAKWGILYQNDGTSSEVADGFKKGKTALTDNVSFERTTTSYASQLAKLQQDGVVNLVFIGNVNQIAVALKEADQVGYKPHWFSSLGNTSPDLAKLTGPLAEGVTTVNPYAPPQSELPGTDEFRAAMDKYQPGKSQSMYALNSWVGGKIIVDALTRAGKDVNRDSFIAALQQTKDLQFGGIMPPITLTAQDRTASTCIVLATVNGGNFKADGPPTCQ